MGLIAASVPQAHVAAAQSLEPTPSSTSFVPVGQIRGAADFVHWTVTVVPDVPDETPAGQNTDDVVGAAGSGVRVLLSTVIDEDWKMYAMDSPWPSRGVSFRLDGLPVGVRTNGEPTQAQPRQAYDSNFDMEVTYFQHEASFAIPLVLDVEAAESAEADSIRGVVTYQICSDSRRLCLPPTPEHFAVAVSDATGCLSDVSDPAGECEAGPLLIGETAPAVDTEETGGDAAGTDPRGPAAGSGETSRDFVPGGRWGGFLLLALAAGFGALLTPCVFPMIPLTVSYFTKHTGDRRRAISMAALFGAGIVATFTALGMVMAVVVGAAGALTIAANPWVNLFIAAVLILFAFSLIGFYDLRLPSSWVNFVSRRSDDRASPVGVLFMALTLTLVSFSCTAPFVGGLLAAASGGTWLRPIIGMIAFSAAFASPFVLLAFFPRMLESLPQSGSWMNAVKVSLGFIELAAAIKFLSNADLVWGFNVISRPLAIAVTVILFVLAGLYLAGKLRVPHETPAAVRIGVGRIVTGIAFFSLAIYLLPGILGAQLNLFDPYFPPRRATDLNTLAPERGGVSADEGWIVDDIEGALAQARELGKPLFVDFTGYSCTNCRQMESSVFPVPAVADLLENEYIRLKLYTDGLEHGPELQKYQIQLTGTVALPTYAVVSPDGGLIERVSGTMSAERMLGFLEAGSARFTALATH